MLAGNRFNWFFVGPDLDHVHRANCDQILDSARNGDPAQYRDNEWVTALYSKNGVDVLGFVHDEYHGEDHNQPQCVSKTVSDRVCWYASTTIIESHDGGHTFVRPAASANVLASLPYPYKPGLRRAGVSVPKVVGNPVDGKVYVFASYSDRNEGARIGQCLFRGVATELTGMGNVGRRLSSDGLMQARMPVQAHVLGIARLAIL